MKDEPTSVDELQDRGPGYGLHLPTCAEPGHGTPTQLAEARALRFRLMLDTAEAIAIRQWAGAVADLYAEPDIDGLVPEFL